MTLMLIMLGAFMTVATFVAYALSRLDNTEGDS